ncbi:hypothetical protein [Nonomuraea candida]|uniref:hypothetical protein n=1 Tax=Nonomuraea candida TaxID=359159 RepID=UPI0005B87F8D|nr:hypothetical protein [Nonomuraea candida]
MSTPDENAPKTGTEPLLEAVREDQEDGDQPRTSLGDALREALDASDRTKEEITGTPDGSDSAEEQ